MASGLNITASIDGMTLQQFQNILQLRMQHMHETARDSVAAMAVDTLRSIRALTKKAKANKPKVLVEREATLKPSFSYASGKRYPCVRINGNTRVTGKTIIVGKLTKGYEVFRWTRHTKDGKPEMVYIMAPSLQTAKQKAQEMQASKIRRYAGLARKALSTLMAKTSTVKINEPTPAAVALKASQLTKKNERVTKSGDGGVYQLALSDDLRYALLALKGGQSSVELALKKAMNKVVSVINHKTKATDFFGNKVKLPTPFPEIRKKK